MAAQLDDLAVVEPGPVTHDGRQTWSARCDRCRTRLGGVTREAAEAWKDGHDTAAPRHNTHYDRRSTMKNEPMPTAEALQHARGLAANADRGLVELTDTQRAVVTLAAVVERVRALADNDLDYRSAVHVGIAEKIRRSLDG